MIIPAIIPKTIADLRTKLDLVSFSSLVQIDVVDGQFDDDVSWPYRPAGVIQEATALLSTRQAQIDLMAHDPVSAGREWLLSGARSLVFHLESLPDPKDAIGLRKDFDFELGFSLSNDTPLERLFPWIDALDFVQLMGIADIGAQGQPFDTRVLERCAALRHLYPALPISIDGGVNEHTLMSLRQAGATRLVVGSAILAADDPHLAYERLLKINDAADRSGL